MLRSLYIKNYAIIDELMIDFEKGFNVFTGETGAGKSIIVGALSFLVKGKADPSIIKSGEEKAIIEGVFSLDDYLIEKLKEADIDYEDELIVRRVISADNHNSIRLNNSSVTLSFLSELFDDYIDIHSQKDSQYLLNRKNHLLLLDRYSDIDALLDEYSSKYKSYKQTKDEYNDLLNNTYSDTEFEFIRYDYKELEDADLRIDEEAELIASENRFKQSEKYLSVLNSSLQMFDEDDGIDEKIGVLIKNLSINDEEILAVQSSLENHHYGIQEEINKLRQMLRSFSEDDFNIDQIEERLYLYSKLKRKHGKDVEGLLKLKNELSEKIHFYEDKDNVLNEKKAMMDKQYEEAYGLAMKIREIRKEKAINLEEEILKQTDDLMLNNVNFKVAFNETELSSKGIDDVEFFISLNKGEEIKPLRNVASGGEISRLMLALKVIFTSMSECGLVIFDEIDTGVSGKVSLAIGKKMKDISKDVQVLTITHLAAVAACAGSHFYIYKEDDLLSSNTRIKRLKEDEIIRELAMISSTSTTIDAINAARELYELAQS